MRLLIVEDEKDLRSVLEKRLKKDGYTVDACEDGESALDYIEVYRYDAILLDLMLPKLDGFGTLKRLRSMGVDTPVVMVTARGAVKERVAGLDAGADDYLVKPFAYDELLARLRVLLRRSESRTSNVLQVEDLTLDIATKKVERGGKPIPLTAKEYLLLEYMMRCPGAVLTRNQLEQQAWDNSFEGGSNIVDVYIRYLRKKVDQGFEHRLIHTVRGLGYRLGGEEG